jgi:hypothetical protein
MLHDGHWLLALGDWMLDRPRYIGARRHKAHDLSLGETDDRIQMFEVR